MNRLEGVQSGAGRAPERAASSPLITKADLQQFVVHLRERGLKHERALSRGVPPRPVTRSFDSGIRRRDDPRGACGQSVLSWRGGRGGTRHSVD